MDHESPDVQMLRLLKAFFQIQNPSSREIIVSLSETAAREESIGAGYVDGENPLDTKPN